MKRFLTLLLLCLTGLLSACGGGSTAAPPAAPAASPTSVTCSLPLQYADGSSSGIAILPQARSVDVHLPASCKLSQLQSATLTVCLDHPRPDELTGQLLLSGAVVTSFQPGNGVLQANRCLSSSSASTALRQFTVSNPDLHGLNPASGPWNVVLSDTVQNNQNGYFVAWVLEIQGL